MTKTRRTRASRTPDPLARVVREALAVERIAIMAQAALRLPSGSAAQTRAMAATDRALWALERQRGRPA